jgi:hypothetical protein
MKKYLSIIAGAALVLAAASCNKLAQSENVANLPVGEYHKVTLNVGSDDALTRASETTVVTGEAAVNSVQVWAFDGSTLAAFAKEPSGSSVTMSLRKDKSYDLYAVANCSDDLSGLTTAAAIEAKTIDLADESRTGFRMYGSGSLAAGSTSADVTVKRVVARIRLKRATCTNSALGEMTIKNVFLSNVVGNQNLAGSAAASTWYNKMGRYDGTQSHFVTTSTAGAPAMTAADAPSLPYPFYCYANSSSVTPNGWSTSYNGQHTMLVIAATFGSGSTVYYYPIDINGQIGGAIQQNYTYDVTATITNYGSTDEPNKEIETGSMTISVSAAAWTAGAEVNKTI